MDDEERRDEDFVAGALILTVSYLPLSLYPLFTE